MSKNLGGWIHSFAVTETSTHKKGYTVYKIASIVFPRAVPEALTCITVWKRFREVKRLYRELLKRHKSLHLRGILPEPKDPGYFKRFEPDVIQYRKDYIIQLLDFSAQHPALYKSHPFLSFFENGHTPTNSPAHQSNIETICDSLDLPFQSEVDLIDPRKDNEQELIYPDTANGGFDEIANDKNYKLQQMKLSPQIDTEINKTRKISDDILKTCNDSVNIDYNDYIYEAAYEFSQAVQAEVNQYYKKAYEKYQAGIDKLLSGSKNDINDDRKSIAKAKVTKYLERSSEMYQKHLLENDDDEQKVIHLSFDETDSSSEKYLERPWNQLSKFKVMKIIDSVMQVQDITDKCIYIMKAIEKPSSNSNAQSIFLPQNVPYMVRLVGFFQSNTTIFLLMQPAKGGKLFDYIQTYTSSSNTKPTALNDIFPDFDKISLDKSVEINQFNSTLSSYDSGYGETINNDKKNRNDKKYMEIESTSKNTENEGLLEYEKREYIPSFDILSQDMDANDLVRCSEKLLRSVSNTLEHFKEIGLETKDIDLDNKEIAMSTETNSNTINENENIKTEIETYFEKDLKPTVHVITPFKKIIMLPEETVKQWARELIVAISNLHSKGVILGDVRPDNMLLGSKGQLLLSYFHKSEAFDTTSQVSISQRSIDGLYVAPERPFTRKSDWWTFGVILFELLTGYTFKSCHPSGLTSYFEIQYPELVDITDTGKDLLNGTLQYNPDFRFNEDQIKSHGFFNGTLWDDVVKVGINSI